MVVGTDATIAERAARARSRWNVAIARQASGWGLVAGSRWLIDSSRAALDRSRPLIRGGADNHEHIKKRLRTLIECGALPSPMPRRMFAGSCREDHSCTACGLTIGTGEQEFEWTNPGNLIFYFHRRCVEIYGALTDGHRTP